MSTPAKPYPSVEDIDVIDTIDVGDTIMTIFQ